MATEKLITDHLNLWTTAIKRKSSAGRSSSSKVEMYGIKKLRELILELAVRGLLVPQDPKDESASEVLKRIAVEKARLTNEGKFKDKNLPPVREKERPFALPKGWLWERFGNLAEHNAGKTLDQGRNQGIPRPYITTSNLYWGRFDLTSVREMPIEEADLDKCLAQKGDLLICEGGEAGRAAVWSFDHNICFQNHIHRARFWQGINPYYAYRFLEKMNYGGEINTYRKGVGISNMSGKALGSIPVPLPPIAEQHRIVAKVDELMALCDQLEQLTDASLSAHQTLVESLLNALTSEADHAQFASAWRHIAEHFDTLFTTEKSIDQLTQTILQLAVMGKLVPQDPNDEPASELLKKIAIEQAKLVKAGRIKQVKQSVPIGNGDKPFQLPKGWEWCRIEDLIFIKHGYAFSSSYFLESDGPFVLTTPGNFFEAGGFRDRGNRTKYYDGPISEEFTLYPDDLIIAMTEQADGLLGSAAFIPDDGKRYLHNQRLGKLIFDRKLLTQEYIFHFFNESFLRTRVADSSTGMKVKHTSPEKVGRIPFPLPPYLEQRRIAARVNELMTLCQQLKSRLSDAQATQLRLADAMIETALSEA